MLRGRLADLFFHDAHGKKKYNDIGKKERII